MDIRAMLNGTDTSPQIVAILSMMSSDIKNLKAENKHLKDLLEFHKSQPEERPLVKSKPTKLEDAWYWSSPTCKEEIVDAKDVLANAGDFDPDDIKDAERVIERAELFGVVEYKELYTI